MSDAAYDRIGLGYRQVRRPDPRIAARIEAALGGARTVLNVGAGAGSYEPAGRGVTAVEPSQVMIDQRPAGAPSKGHWLGEYFPRAMEIHREAMLPLEQMMEALGPSAAVEQIPIPRLCEDGFFIALWDRPELHLDPEVRRASSVWHLMEAEEIESGITALRADLESGAWDARHGDLRTAPELDVGLRLIVSG